MFNIPTFYNSLLHEFGHVNLLDHSQYYNTVMASGMIYFKDTDRFLIDSKKDKLTLDDTNGITYRYTKYIYDENCVRHGPYESLRFDEVKYPISQINQNPFRRQSRVSQRPIPVNNPFSGWLYTRGSRKRNKTTASPTLLIVHDNYEYNGFQDDTPPTEESLDPNWLMNLFRWLENPAKNNP